MINLKFKILANKASSEAIKFEVKKNASTRSILIH